ncbi:MAG: hypothetical protein ACRD23_07885 [Terriglobales bacterium]
MAAVAVSTAGVVAVSMAEAVVVSTAAAVVASAVVAVPVVGADFIAVAGDLVEARPTAARGLLVEEVTTGAEVFVRDQPRATTERAGVRTAGSAHRAA